MQKPAAQADTDSNIYFDDSCPAVSLSAILAGAAVITALSAILLLLASGLGFAFVSPWSDEPLTATKFTVATAVWMILIQWIPSAFGGYLTGRLRRKWIGVDTDEVFFRDTAQGLVAWALAALAGIALVLGASFAGATVSGAAAMMMGQQSDGLTQGGIGPLSYYVDNLFRGNRTGTPINRDTREEVFQILTKSVLKGPMRDEDRSYLTQLISTRTGMDPAAAGPLVDDTITQIKNTVNEARKAAASAMIFTFLSMVIGAFTASAMAACGGRHRDEQAGLGLSNGRRA